MEGDEEGIFSKAPNWKPLFLLEIRIKQNPGCPNKEYNAIFKHFYMNIKAYARGKKMCIDQWLGKYCILRKIWAKQGVGEQVWFVSNTVVESGVSRNSFSNDLSLEAVSPVLKLTQNCYINMNIFFLKKGSLIINWVPFCVTNILCLKKFPYNATKHEMKGTSKIPISQLFSELGKFLKCSLGLNLENSIFYLFHELRKIGKSS